jgi:hypothetical protein
MRYIYLSPLQKIDIGISSLFFCILIGFLRPLLISQNLNTRNVIAYTLLFFAWYGCTLLFSNGFNYESNYRKIVDI